ncbi:hypothetical protein [Fibrobacter intestinalis]|nr:MULTISPECIES: hypothetical protein [Fibrobacter]
MMQMFRKRGGGQNRALGFGRMNQKKRVLKSIPKGKSIIEWEEESTSYA